MNIDYVVMVVIGVALIVNGYVKLMESRLIVGLLLTFSGFVFLTFGIGLLLI